MAHVLNDAELKKLIGTVILHGDPACVRPNSYILRLGSHGEFHNTGKDIELGRGKKGIILSPGHSVGVTALEVIDFRRETVHKIYPGCDLHGILSPTTDLSRESVVTQTTQIDAGYHGTLNWTLCNTANADRRFMYQEKLFRLTILRLEAGETPEGVYAGDYQGREGYVPSQRAGPPVGMRESEWEVATVAGGPEELLENLIKSGYPWNVLGTRLKIINQQFETVTHEYADIRDAVDGLRSEVRAVSDQQKGLSSLVRDAVHAETQSWSTTMKSSIDDFGTSLQNRWLVSLGSMLFTLVGAWMAITGNERISSYVSEHSWIGLIIMGLGLVGIAVVAFLTRRRR